MSSGHPTLEYNCFYHLYNRGINRCSLFLHSADYTHFLRLYDKYITPVADTYAWALMGNHFHLLVRIKPGEQIGFISGKQATEGLSGAPGPKENLSEFVRPESVYFPKKYKPINQFSHLFNAYTKYFNKKYKRTGSLFEHPFRRIKIESDAHLKYLVYYIHHNPVHHGSCEEMVEYPWSSYLTVLSPKQTRLKRGEVIQWYGKPELFRDYHDRQSVERFAGLQIDMPVLLIKP
ncbi:MAG: hypothetical protein RBS73_13120 [Prolixibacteraceae bacterium]|nr:hypothetical protein [Prolixibacteraceae bacterium]